MVQSPERLRRGFHSLRLLAALSGAALLLGACTGDDGTATATPTPEATPTAEVTPRAATSTPTVEVTPAPTWTPPPRRTGVMILDVRGVGEHSTYYDGESPLLVGDSLYPSFAADGSVWVSASGWTGAVQFSTEERSEVREIEGAWGVSTTADESRLAYYLREDGPTSPDLAIEYDGSIEVIPGPIDKHEFSPDGTRVAYYREDGVARDSLYVLDLDTSETTMLASAIDRCQCEFTLGPVWSPSGDYTAYVDYGVLGSDEASRGVYVVPAAGGEPVEIGDDIGNFAGWLPGVAGDVAVTDRDGGVLLYDAMMGESRLLVSSDGRSVNARILGDRPLLQVQSTDRSTADTVTSLWDAVSGEELARWELRGEATLTSEGPAIVSSQNARAGLPFCNGLAAVHAALAEPLCVEQANRGEWSPDGSLLAFHANSRESTDDWIGVWSPEGGLLFRFDVPPDTSLIEWNADGTHILVAWGIGP